MKIKVIVRNLTIVALLWCCFSFSSKAQMFKVNLPFWALGSPNIGFECTLTKQFTLDLETMWVQDLFKKKNDVFRICEASAEARYYVNPHNFYTNDSWDGFYIGPYAMFGLFNIGFINKKDPDSSMKNDGWGLSGGVTTGYKYSFNSRWGLDVNLGLGTMFLQWNKTHMTRDQQYITDHKDTKMWYGPTKFGVSLTYNLFR